MNTATKILIVEHNPDDIELILHELNIGDINFIPQIVENETAYIKAITEFLPDIILSDYALPSFDGSQTFKIRQQLAPLVPFIFVSGSIGEEKSIEYIRNGVTDYVLKESLFTLAVKVKRALQESKERQHKNKLEDDLFQRERQLNIAQQIAHVGSWELNFADNVLVFSEEACKIFGVKREQNHLSFETWSALVHPDDLDNILKAIKDSRDAIPEESFYNHRIIRYDKAVRHIYSESKFVTDTEGERIGMHGIVYDVTEKKLTEEKLLITAKALQEALDGLNKIMGASLDIICTIDEEGKFVTISAASEPVLGYKPEELKGQKYIDLVFKEDLENTIQAAAGIMSGTPVTVFENRYLHKKGSIVPLLWSATWDDNDKLMYCIAKDATEKKVLEKAFENERQRFHDLFLQAPTSMGILKGPTHIFETANPLYLRLTGKADIIGKTVKEVMPELERQGFINLLDRVYRTGETFKANEMLIQLDQHNNGMLIDKYLDFIYQANRNAEGLIEGIFFFAIDVSEQVLSRKKIEETENRFRAIIEKSAEMITLSDKDGKMLYISPSAIKGFGYNLSEINQVLSFDFIHPDDVNDFAKKRKVIIKKDGASCYSQLRLKHKNGNWIWCEATLTNMLHEPGVNSMVSNFRDISEKKAAQQQLDFDRNNLDALINNTNDLLWSVDRNFNLVSFNKPFDEIVKHMSGKGLAKGANVLNAFPDDQLKRYKKYYERAFAGNVFTEIEFNETPLEFWSEISFYPIREGNDIVGTACHSRDITERKKAEIQLDDLNKELQKHAKDLATSNAELEQFAYVASHDLQEPLRMITSFLTQLERKYGEVIDAKGKKYIDFAVDGAKRMRQIILDLLEFSRVGSKEDDKEEVDLDELLNGIKILFRKKIEDKTAEITVGKMPLIYAYKTPLRQVFQNLIGNALKYSRENIPAKIQVTAKAFKDHWQFAVTDNGIGINKEYFDKIFIIFQRLHNKDEYSGTGMGLAITKKIIENQGGKIWLQSEEGKGSTFYFTILK